MACQKYTNNIKVNVVIQNRKDTADGANVIFTLDRVLLVCHPYTCTSLQVLVSHL